jgi:hypothetical protein
MVKNGGSKLKWEYPSSHQESCPAIRNPKNMTSHDMKQHQFSANPSPVIDYSRFTLFPSLFW